MKKRILSLLALFCGFFASTSAIYNNNEPPKQTNDNYLTFTNNSTNDIQFRAVKSGTTTISVSLIYSTDKASSWNNFVVGSYYTIEAGKSFKLAAGSNGEPGKTINKSFNNSESYLNLKFFDSSGSTTLTDPVVSISGDITSLLNGVGGDVDLSSTEGGADYSYCFRNLFSELYCITTAPNLPSTNLVSNCYNSMFSSCTSLVSAPNLPALTLAEKCYYQMFNNCTSLTFAPKLPATTLANVCYQSMFKGCTSLVSAPNLPALTLAAGCYSYMFEGCTSLVSAPELPTTTLANQCYHSMFKKCRFLVKIPDLAHVTSIGASSLNSMFYGCTKLTIKTATGEGNWSIGTSDTTGSIPGGSYVMFSGCADVDFGSGSKSPVKGTKYYLGIPGVSFEPITSLGGYYNKGGAKQAMCTFGVTAISDNLASITEFGFAVYNGTSYEDTIKTTDTEKLKDLVTLSGRFYTIIDCNGAGVTKKVKAYAKISDTRYESSEISATSNLDSEYSI